MIKSDYKTKNARQDIFSSSRKRSSRPVVIMAIIAILMISWGLWSTFSQPDSESTTEVITDDSKSIDLDMNALDSQSEPEIDENGEVDSRQELQLDFQHQGRSKSKDSNLDAKKKSSTNTKISKKSERSNASNRSHASDISRYNWKKTKIRSGDSMARIFKRNGFSPTDLHSIISIGESTKILKKIKPGKHLEYSTDSEGKLEAVRYAIDRLKTVTIVKSINKDKSQWQAELDTKTVELRTANARGTIKSSLFLAGKNAGLTDAMVMELAGIFGWDIDFILDIRENDQFTVIYEEKFVNGEKIGNGNILAAEFINQDKSYKAVRYTSKSGRSEYFTPNGFSMRKAFLRAPVDFSYISSSFNPRRFHPILKRVKAHNGVDYRAPKGTPVKAAGDGKVLTSAYSRYNGHHVFIQHGQKFVTKYLHFTKRKVRRGQKVKQGQIIGYVGATGLAEAPHLHYEFLVNGVHRNPRTIKLPDAKPINKKEKQSFLNATRALVKQLDTQSLIYSDDFNTAE